LILSFKHSGSNAHVTADRMTVLCRKIAHRLFFVYRAFIKNFSPWQEIIERAFRKMELTLLMKTSGTHFPIWFPRFFQSAFLTPLCRFPDGRPRRFCENIATKIFSLTNALTYFKQ